MASDNLDKGYDSEILETKEYINGSYKIVHFKKIGKNAYKKIEELPKLAPTIKDNGDKFRHLGLLRRQKKPVKEIQATTYTENDPDKTIETKMKNLICEIVRNNSLLKLKLSNNGFTNVPPDIGRLKDLTYCDLSCNKLKNLPAAFYTLGSLQYVNLSKNAITDLSDQISRLCNLEIFDCSNNLLSMLPESIGNLKQLKQLLIRNNTISLLPANVCELSALKTLDISNNCLLGLPANMQRCKNLKYVLMQNNLIDTLKSLVGCKKLIVLNAQHNALSKLPSKLSASMQLLNLAKNKLKELPVDFYDMKELRKLDISNNNFTKVPCLAFLNNLEVFNLDNNPIKIIYRDVFNGRRRQKVILVQRSKLEQNYIMTICNKDKEQDVQNKGQNKNIKVLSTICAFNVMNFAGKKLENLPIEFEYVCQCAHELQTTYKWNNVILPPFIEKFMDLTKMNLERNQLSYLPESFGVLTRLMELNISQNCFTELPSCIYKLRNLVSLNAQDNQISKVDFKKLQTLTKLQILKLNFNRLNIETELSQSLKFIKDLDISHNPAYETTESITRDIAHMEQRFELIKKRAQEITDEYECIKQNKNF